ncbi:bifunctional glutamate N-acetyltransferase/amino-acid acetyltransferase ArgJ [Desulfovibrio sp.]
MIPVPKDFLFGAAAAGFKRPDRLDLGVILSARPAQAAGVFTTNKFQAAPVLVCKERLNASRTARALLANSGQANACTGEEGLRNCRLTQEMVAKALKIEPGEVLPASTGVIGAQLRVDKWKEAVPALKKSLGQVDAMGFARAVMTTDKFPKAAWSSVRVGGKEVRLLGMAKGAGMISPNMATMLGFVLCDADVEPDSWREMLRSCADRSFNRVTVDGDTSTNDCILALANGASGARVSGREANVALEAALLEVLQGLAYMIVQDAEGGTKVARISVTGAADAADAERAARAVGNSPLVKTALFGQDPNWGRIVAAVGRSGAEFEPEDLVLSLGGVVIFEKGRPASGDLDGVLAPIMRRQDIDIRVSLGAGPGEYSLLASDLTKEYVAINADYRT